ncbi:MAG: hypothetical protein Q9224_007328 [Gallowayella concinna]
MASHHTHFLCQEALWEKKRREMLARITELEDQLSQFYIAAAKSKLDSNPHGIYPGKSQASPLKKKAGNEIGLGGGGKRDAAVYPTVFPATTVDTLSSRRRLSRMAENAPSQLTKNIPDEPDSTKSTNIASKSATNSSGSYSTRSDPSTGRSSSPRQSPKSLPLPSPPRFPDNHTKDAGHTPLAGAKYNMDGIVSSGPSTPILPPEQDDASLEWPTSARIPSERSDSYFPPSSDGDRELKGPLGLKNDDPGNDRFMAELIPRLEQLNPETPRSRPARRHRDPEVEEILDRTPPLRIKTYLNFGSQMGGIYKLPEDD